MSEDTQEGERDWEDEGGSPSPEPTQKTPKGLEIPVPTRRQIVEGFRMIVRPVKQKPKSKLKPKP